jgi:hypothetical protein
MLIEALAIHNIHENYFSKYDTRQVATVTKTDLVKQLGLGRFIYSSMTTYIRKNSQSHVATCIYAILA